MLWASGPFWRAVRPLRWSKSLFEGLLGLYKYYDGPKYKKTEKIEEQICHQINYFFKELYKLLYNVTIWDIHCKTNKKNYFQYYFTCDKKNQLCQSSITKGHMT